MAKEFEHLARNLASHIVDLRKRRGLTQGQLAEMAEIPRSTLANLESGMGNPSLLNLAKICGALGVAMEEILSTPRAPVSLIRREDVPVNKKAKGLVTVYDLLPDAVPGMAIDRMEFEPRAKMGGVPHTAGTKEYFHCVQGQIRVVVAGEKYDLSPGDVLAFPGDAAHAYWNMANIKALGFSVVVLAPRL